MARYSQWLEDFPDQRSLVGEQVAQHLAHHGKGARSMSLPLHSRVEAVPEESLIERLVSLTRSRSDYRTWLYQE